MARIKHVGGTTEKFIQRDLGSFKTATQIALAQHPCEKFLGAACSPMDGTVVVASRPGIAVAAEEDADEPEAPARADDLSNATSQRNSLPKSGTRLAHWRGATVLPLQSLRGDLGEGQSSILGEKKGNLGRPPGQPDGFRCQFVDGLCRM